MEPGKFQRLILRENIVGAKRLSNLFFALVLTLGGLGFLLTGLSSFYRKSLLWFINVETINFIPQGIVLVFYGTTAIILGTFLWMIISWDVGGGFNEYNKEKEQITLTRLGFPGKNREISLTYEMKEVQAIKVSITEGLNPKREIYLRTKNQREIPLTPVGAPIVLAEIEEKAIELAQFIGVRVEGL